MEIEQRRTFWYRLPSGAALLTLGAAFGLGHQVISAANKEDTLREVAAFRLSMGKLHKVAQADSALEKLSMTDPSLKSVAQFGYQDGARSIEDTVKRIDDSPRALAAIQGTGLSTRDYVFTMYCFEQSAQALFVKHPTPGASKANVVFVRKHLKEINRLFSESP